MKKNKKILYVILILIILHLIFIIIDFMKLKKSHFDTKPLITTKSVNKENEINDNNILKEEEKMDEKVINININGISYDVTLEDNETALEFLNELPLNITMNELNNNEKYYYFDDSFTSKPLKINKINAGDLMLYGDNCLVLFYETFNTSYSYTKVGKINNPKDLKNNVDSGSINVTFNRK